MKLLSKKQKKDLVFRTHMVCIMLFSVLVKLIFAMIFFKIGTLLGINCFLLAVGFAVANGNDAEKYIKQFIKD